MHTYVEIKCVYWGKGPSVDTVHAYVCSVCVHYIIVLNVNMNICTTLCVYEYNMSIHTVCMELSFSQLTHGSFMIL